VGEPHNPEDIGVHEMNMHIEDFFSARTKSNQDYELIHWNINKTKYYEPRHCWRSIHNNFTGIDWKIR
jgi:DNA polymerase sigma